MTTQYTFDPDIDWYYAENNGLVFTSGAKIVSAVYVVRSHAAAAARIAELEARIAELEATQPLPEWTGKRVVAIGDRYGVTAYDAATICDATGRLP